jgi:protein SCO1/2
VKTTLWGDDARHAMEAARRGSVRRDSVMLAAALVMVAAVVTGATHDGARSALPYYRSAEWTPEWLSDRDAARATMHHVGAFTALNQAGETVSESALAGKVTVVQFFFATCGDICPVTTSNLGRLLRDLPDAGDLQVLSYSVNPSRDSVGALRMFAAMRGIGDRRWQLLTMDSARTAALARESYFVRIADGKTFGVSTIAHTESVVLVDGAGRLRGVYAGTLPLEMQKLKEDIETLRREQGAGKPQS